VKTAVSYTTPIWLLTVTMKRKIGCVRKIDAAKRDGLMGLKVITMGVYGFDRERFMRALLDANVDTFCDLRFRRGMRGMTYAFANGKRLQQMLQMLGVRYLYCKELAPSLAVRAVQHRVDKARGIAIQKRETLGQEFIQAYEQECLTNFDARQFLERLGPEAHVVVLFCVEREPGACHRSLVAERLALLPGTRVEHIRP
jgi:uncharacterized protein (DUF488 family)